MVQFLLYLEIQIILLGVTKTKCPIRSMELFTYVLGFP